VQVGQVGGGVLALNGRARPFSGDVTKVIREHGRKLGSLIKVRTSISPVVVVDS
jgi:hypothetical protein